MTAYGEGLDTAKKRAGFNLTRLLELPPDTVMDVPRVTIIGALQVLVENHRGIAEFSPEVVRITTGQGTLVLRGGGFYLREVKNEKVVIVGEISSLEFETRRG